MELTTNWLEMADALVEKKWSNVATVMIGFEAYEKAYESTGTIRVLIDPTEEEIEDAFPGGIDDVWEVATWHLGKRA